MKGITHPNVVGLVAMVTLSEPMLVLVEYAHHGDLLRIVHRDLAARNVLVADVNRCYVVKIADFGLSRNIEGTESYYVKTKNQKLPVKWLAPKCLSRKHFTEKSDVWAYGITLWKILL
eukprot:Opistho-2@8828